MRRRHRLERLDELVHLLDPYPWSQALRFHLFLNPIDLITNLADLFVKCAQKLGGVLVLANFLDLFSQIRQLAEQLLQLRQSSAFSDDTSP